MRISGHAIQIFHILRRRTLAGCQHEQTGIYVYRMYNPAQATLALEVYFALYVKPYPGALPSIQTTFQAILEFPFSIKNAFGKPG